MLVAICRPTHELLVRDRKVARSYAAAGHRVVFLGNTRATTPHACPDVTEHHYVGFGYPYRSKLMPLGTLAYSYALLRKLRTVAPDTIFAGDLEGLLGAAVYKRWYAPQCTLIYDIADNFAGRYRLAPWAQAAIQYLDDMLMTHCDEVILPQENRYANFRFRRPKQWRLVPNCPFLDEAPPVEPLPQPTPVRILLSGLITWNRGVREITEAARHSGVGQVVLVPSLPMDKDVAEYLATSGIVEQHSPMSQREVLRLTQTCHLVAAYYEPSCTIHLQAAPNKVFDAMAAARPSLLNAETEVSRQVVETWHCGFAVPYGDSDALSQLLATIHRDLSLCHELGMNGRRLFESQYHWEHVTQDIGSWGKPTPSTLTETRAAA
jgi:glycosyltransferase involved in cell wall biosynthesis